MKAVLAALVVVALIVVPAHAGLIDHVIDTTPGGPTVDGTVNVGEYVGTVSGGGGGFGGPIGNGTLSVDSDANGVYFGFSGLGDFSGNAIRIYLDSRSGGFNDLSGSGISDFGDDLRGWLSRPAEQGLTLPFDADFGWLVSPYFGGATPLYELQAGGDNSFNEITSGVQTSSPGEFPTNPEIELFVEYSSLGMSAGDPLDFVVIYANQNNGDRYMSDEGFPFQVQGGNPGQGPVTLNDYDRISTIPEPATIGLLAIGAIGFIRRRR